MPRVLALVLVAAGFLVSPCALSAQSVVWLADHAAAVTQARKQGKLLFVVHLSGDFAVNSEQSVEARLYRNLTLSDARIAAALADRFVVTCRHVGEAKAMPRLGEADKNRPFREPTFEMALTYICLPDERVLHFIPGFLSPEELLAELQWVEAGYSKAVRTQGEDWALTWRELHRSELDEADCEHFAGRFDSRWTDASTPPEYSTVDLPRALAAARVTWELALADRLGPPDPLGSRRGAAIGVRQETLTALAAHGRLGAAFSHLILSEFSLPYLRDLARPAFEARTRSRYWEASPRRHELAAWWSECREHSRRTMLIRKDEDFAADSAARAARHAELWRIAPQIVTTDELAQLLTDANLEPLVYNASDGPPRYIVHDARGFRCAIVSAGEASAEKLDAALRSAIENTSALAAQGAAPIAGDKSERGRKSDE